MTIHTAYPLIFLLSIKLISVPIAKTKLLLKVLDINLPNKLSKLLCKRKEKTSKNKAIVSLIVYPVKSKWEAVPPT